MFEKCLGPRIFGLPPGVNFSQSFVSGLKFRLQNLSPETIANAQIYLNSKRMLQKVREELTDYEAAILPNLSTIDKLDNLEINRTNVINPLSLRLELAQLISKFIEFESDFGSQNSCFDLADSLATLIQELHEEGLSIDVIAELNLEDYSEYWQRNKKFFILIRDYFIKRKVLTIEQHRWRVIESLEEKWISNPPSHPIMIVGSTGSKGTTQKFIKLVSNLPQGAVILPGVDFETSKNVWDTLGGTKNSNINIEDHPQYRLKALTSSLNIALSEIRKWTDFESGKSSRNKLISLSMQPAPVTDNWLKEGPKLKNIDKAIDGITVLEAPSERVEALAISMGIKKALEDSKTCLVITPNRILARKISAALRQWGLEADDAAGVPLSLSVVGRLFLKVSNLIGNKLNTLNFMELLKHPLVCNKERGPHLKKLRALEITFLRGNPNCPNKDSLLNWANSFNGNKELTKWVTWIFECLDKIRVPKYQTVGKHLQVHTETIRDLINGPNKIDAAEVWRKPDGKELLEVISEIENTSQISELMNISEYSNLIYFLLRKSNIRNAYNNRSDVMIWGTQETRVCDADIVFLAGLNDGIWPPLPTPDPWINRPMRKKANLLLPERLIGLSAHDFQQGVASKEVWLTRSIRDSEAETLPSRWLNRLFNLLEGLSDKQPSLLSSMKTRGQFWLDLIENYEKPKNKIELAKRPSPIPPISCRPKALSVTQIENLIRDPYTIYAKYILNLKPLKPLVQKPDAALRGQIIHLIMEKFINLTKDHWPKNPFDLLDQISNEILLKYIPQNFVRLFWKRRINSFSEHFIFTEKDRRKKTRPILVEEKGSIELRDLNFKLTGIFDRIDEDSKGNVTIYDYKTGVIPSDLVQQYFDKQLLLLALIINKGGIKKLKHKKIKEAFYIDLSSNPKTHENRLISQNLDVLFEDFKSLILKYNDKTRGYMARRAVFETRWSGDYDHLSRFGEWDHTQTPNPEVIKK